MKSTILIQLIALPAILASFQVGIMYKDGHEGVSVTGRKNSDGKVFNMNNSATEVDKTVLCLVDGEWSRWGCGERDKYYQAGIFNFTKPIQDPQDFQESQDFQIVKFKEFKQDCTVSVTGKAEEDLSYLWDIDNGWMGQPSDIVTIVCQPRKDWKGKA